MPAGDIIYKQTGYAGYVVLLLRRSGHGYYIIIYSDGSVVYQDF